MSRNVAERLRRSRGAGVGSPVAFERRSVNALDPPSLELQRVERVKIVKAVEALNCIGGGDCSESTWIESVPVKGDFHFLAAPCAASARVRESIPYARNANCLILCRCV